MLRWLLAALALTGALIAIVLVALMYRAGAFRQVDAFLPGTCRAQAFAGNIEDMAVDHARLQVFIASSDRMDDGVAQRGSIHRLDVAGDERRTIDITPDQPVDFSPRGMGLWAGPDGQRVLYVVNHLSFGGRRIEAFEVRGGSLVYLGPGVASRDILSPNDVVAAGPSSFYATNDHGRITEFGRLMEDALGLAEASVGLFDGTRLRPAADGLAHASGIALSPDGRTLYVAETTAERISLFTRDPDTGSLRLRSALAMDSHPIGLDVAPDGSVWVAAQPNLMATLDRSRNPATPVPSEVYRLEPQGEGPETGLSMERILADPGDTVAAVSVAVNVGRHLLLGSSMDNSLFDCTLR
ncbi:SMP-30/gluconolactonase/LRE family protein [Zavarzinia sp. CC-PAN008]|uniref:SMP-30/gluconolactonase/LRE family protein n=1 Tax=Zavarzinia sp. CC-PAN008 TaxID=3243332 RepID=UPI003F747FE8